MAEGNEPQPLGVSGQMKADPTNYPNIVYYRYGKVVMVNINGQSVTGGTNITVSGFPRPTTYTTYKMFGDDGLVDVNGSGILHIYPVKEGTHTVNATFCYLTVD